MASIADRDGRPYLYAIVEGLGPQTDTAPSSYAYRFVYGEDPGLSPSGRWLPYVTDVPGVLETGIDLVTGETEVGSLTLEILEGPNNSAFMTDLFATRERAVRADLAANVAVGAAFIDVRDQVGAAAVNDVIALGDERLKITNVNLGGGWGGFGDRLTVTRAYYGTTARAHFTAESRGDGEVRWRAHYLRGRKVALYLNFQGNLETHAILVGTFLLDRLELVEGVKWRLHLRGIEALLDAELGHRAYNGTTENLFADSLRSAGRGAFDGGDREIAITHSGDAGAGQPDPDDPFDLAPDSFNGGYLQIGDTCAEYDRDAALAIVGGQCAVTVTAWRIGRTELPTSNDPLLLVREVLPTDKALPHTRFKPTPSGGVPTASDHPIEVFLCLCLSTGTSLNFGAGQTNYDSLPKAWGRAIPVAQFDVTAWEAMKDATPGARVPNLVVGWDGAFNLAEFAQRELLGPIGVACVQDEAGLLSPVRVTEVFPDDAPTALGAADIIPATETVSWDMADQILAQSWKYDHAGPEGKPGQEIRFEAAEARERYRNAGDGHRTLVVEARGLDETGIAVVLERVYFLFRHFQEPPPRVSLKLNWHHLRLALGSAVSVTYGALPNPATGTRGVTSEGFLVMGRRMVFRDLATERGRGGGIGVDLFWVGLDSPDLAHWASSAEVSANDGIAHGWVGVTVDVEENSFTDGTARGSIVADDTDGFVAGGAGVGDTVILLDSDGVCRCANTPRVTAKTATTLVLSDVFRDGVGVEVARNLGDIVVYSGDTGAASYPISAWTATMQEYGALADETNLTIGTTSRLNQYG